jgi:2,4-dienoyl-CoA reductase-like NADH-dependent reductase (Old Yellow Enzyme family)
MIMEKQTRTTFESAKIGRLTLPNRILRSATFEGLCDAAGCPGPAYTKHYSKLASQGLGAMITGFAYIHPDGRAMQPGQAGLDSDDKIDAFKVVTQAVHAQGGRIILQIAHAGRQTVPAATGGAVFAPSTRKSVYFNVRPQRLTVPQCERIINDFAAAARRAQMAGFDGVQLHAAHGYLIHQFLHPAVNDRTDEFGIDGHNRIGTAFLDRIIDAVRTACGPDYPLLIKISAGDSYHPSFGTSQFIQLIQFLNSKPVDAIEISFGTMDQALNIFRGESVPIMEILNHNPRYATHAPFKRFLWQHLVLPLMAQSLHLFTPMYNLDYALQAKQHTRIPIICVGGFRSGEDMEYAIAHKGLDFVSLSRPLICEPDLALKLRRQPDYRSRCINCNRCAIMCDAGVPTRCYTHSPSRKEMPHEARR